MHVNENNTLKNIVLIIISLTFMLCLSVILVPILLIFYIISVIQYHILKLKYGSRICFPNGQDIIHGIQNKATCRYLHLLFTMDGDISFKAFKQHVWKKYQMNDFPIKDRRLRRYQQKYVNIAGYNYFIDDLNPNINYHFIEITTEELYNDPRLRSDPNSIKSFINEEQCNDEWQLMVDHVMKKYGNEKMDENKAQWQFYFYKHGNGYTFIFRFNHVIVDGVHFARFLLGEFGEKSIIQHLPYYHQKKNIFKRYTKLLWDYFMLPFAMKKFLTNPGNHCLHGPELSGIKTRIASEAIPLRDIKEIKKALKTNFNAIIFSATAYAFRCHYRQNGQAVAKSYVAIPVSRQDLRKEVKTKNSHGVMGVLLTTETDDPENDCAIMRLRRIEKDLIEAESYTDCEPTQLAIRMFCPIFPEWLIKIILQAQGLTALMSNMPGPTKEKIQIGNTYSREMVFWASDRNPTGMGITFLGNIDTMRVGLHIDVALMKTNKEAYDFLENIRDEINRLKMELGLGLSVQQTELILNQKV